MEKKITNFEMNVEKLEKSREQMTKELKTKQTELSTI